MKKNEAIIELATQIIENEANAIIGLRSRIDDDFQNAVKRISHIAPPSSD